MHSFIVMSIRATRRTLWVPKRRSSERNYAASVNISNRYLEVIPSWTTGRQVDFIVNRIQSTFGMTQLKGRRREGYLVLFNDPAIRSQTLQISSQPRLIP